MTPFDIALLRLSNQQIARHTFEKPADLVGWLGAVQAQDYASAKWALGLRMYGATDDDIERAFTDGSILRTHLMRPTWHFVTPGDIRWILGLTAPRVHAINATYYRKLDLDQTIFRRSNTALVRALRGGKQLTRAELRGVLQRAGIATEGLLRLGYIVMHAELDGILCSGPRRGRQFTYMLLDERAPQAATLTREESLAELARRYFRSHGPATVQDFVWWSGLTTADARNGLEVIKVQLSYEVVEGQTYWFSAYSLPAESSAQTAYLLPNYDEYGSYKDRSAVIDPSNTQKLVFSHMVVINGRIAGTWKRTLKKNAVVIESNSFLPLTKAEKEAFTMAARQYGAFLELPVVLA